MRMRRETYTLRRTLLHTAPADVAAATSAVVDDFWSGTRRGWEYHQWSDVSSSTVIVATVSTNDHLLISSTASTTAPPSGELAIQWNLQTRDTMGPAILSVVERSSLSWRSNRLYSMGLKQVSFVERSSLHLGGSLIGGSTV